MPERRLPPTDTTGPLCLRALNTAIGRTPLWITASVMTSLLALVVAMPWFSWFQDAMDHRYAPGSLLVGLDETFLVIDRDTGRHWVRSAGWSEVIRACSARRRYVELSRRISAWRPRIVSRSRAHAKASSAS